jgi:hypothetical protein
MHRTVLFIELLLAWVSPGSRCKLGCCVVSNWHHGLGIRMQVAGSANVGALHGTEFMGIMVVGLVIDLHRGERWY